jgi:hypothetical protein
LNDRLLRTLILKLAYPYGVSLALQELGWRQH